MKKNLSKLAILSVAIALSLSAPAMACKFKRQAHISTTWLNSPLAMVLAIPGIALGVGLYVGGRAYERQG